MEEMVIERREGVFEEKQILRGIFEYNIGAGRFNIGAALRHRRWSLASISTLVARFDIDAGRSLRHRLWSLASTSTLVARFEIDAGPSQIDAAPFQIDAAPFQIDAGRLQWTTR
ncbi:unnamed protein product, partial [Mesorhabditis belari]|uniref:Uncharacterized protein n=1 Tax=Mesorhabditis belari TaxID=2138241 RepID=A0AAF3ET36_9BILA